MSIRDLLPAPRRQRLPAAVAGLAAVIVCLTVAVAHAATGAPHSELLPAARQPVDSDKMAFDRNLPRMDGAHLNLKVIDVMLAPGDSSAPHRHGCAVVVYVVSGALHMQVRGGPDSVYHRGETFFERPTDVHQRSANASASDSARFTATFVCDHVGPLSTPPDGGR